MDLNLWQVPWVGLYFDELEEFVGGFILDWNSGRSSWVWMDGVKVGATQWEKGQWGDTHHEMAEWVTSHCQETTRSIVGIKQTPGEGELEQAGAGGGRCCYLGLIFAYLHMRAVGQSLPRLAVQRWLEPWKLPGWDEAQRVHASRKKINRYEVNTLQTQPLAGSRLPTPAWSNCLLGAISRVKSNTLWPIWSSPM